MNFPQYRKYKNNKHFFKIVSLNAFEEISFIGTKAFISNKTALILPDRNFIMDLLHGDEAVCEMSDELEFENKKGLA